MPTTLPVEEPARNLSQTSPASKVKMVNLDQARQAMDILSKKQTAFHPDLPPPPTPAIANAAAKPAPAVTADSLDSAPTLAPEKKEPAFLTKAAVSPTTPPSVGEGADFMDYLSPRTKETVSAADPVRRPPAGKRIQNPETAVLESDIPAEPSPLVLSGSERVTLDEPVALEEPATMAAAKARAERNPPPAPALPEPVSTPVVARPAPAVKEQEQEKEALSAEPELPDHELPRSLKKAAAMVENGENLSESEREFVKSLAKAANRDFGTDDHAVKSGGGGKKGSESVLAVVQAAKEAVKDLPPDTFDRLKERMSLAQESLRESVKESLPDLPTEITNDLMPATAEKMPPQLPAFNGPAEGKVDVQSDEKADYDQVNNKVVFTGKVELNSKAIRLRADRVEIFMKKTGGGMERVEASGHVLMRTQATENAAGQMASAGRALYDLTTGEITLSEWPKIQEEGKSHVSTSAGTKMYLFTDGRVRTDGPNRTLIGR